MRSTSGMFVAPDLRMSSWETTKTAEAVRDRLCSVFDTEVTWIFIRSSILAELMSCGAGEPDADCCAGHAPIGDIVSAIRQAIVFSACRDRDWVRVRKKEC